MNARAFAAFAIVWLALHGTACKDDIVHSPSLELDVDDEGHALGFNCPYPPTTLEIVGELGPRRDTTARVPLANRLRTTCGGTGAACMIVDAFSVPDGTGCIASQVSDACGATGCAPLASFRVKKELTLDASALSSDPGLAVTNAMLKLKGEPLWDGVPSGSVILRVVVTAEACADVQPNAGPSCAKVVGCATSCPIVLDGADGKALLSLVYGPTKGLANDKVDAISRDVVCGHALLSCAATPLGTDSTCGDNLTNTCR